MTLRQILNLSPDQAAPLLLGSTITTSNEAGEITGGILVEVEAYLPENDPASHSHIGETKRNGSMFKDAGTFYVYTLRHHSLANIVTEGKERAGAILFRAIEPTVGIEIMQRRRNRQIVTHLGSGPGKLTAALGITIKDNGIDILEKTSRIKLIPSQTPLNSKEIMQTTRIGISKNAAAPLRFYIKDSPFISNR